jgi:hypothetical protein
VPSLLLLIARDLLLHDPPRVIAWRISHEPSLAGLAARLAPVWPRLPEWLDRDPLALLLAAFATGLALAYLLAAVGSASARVRALLIGAGGFALVVLPAAALVTMGMAAGRPYGQDGGVVQLPLALEKILGGHSPYGADYSDSILGKEARVSWFWAQMGGNPILHHHAYLPGMHLLMMPAYLLCRALFGGFDPRLVTFAFFALAALLAPRLVDDAPRKLAAAALVAVNPLVYWQQAFGANDIIPAALLMAAAILARRDQWKTSSAMLGLACATKQLAWPFAPFLLVYLAVSRSRLLRAAAVAAGTFLLVVLPVVALDPQAFWDDIVGYNVGLPGADNYPLGGTPGFGVANVLIYFGRVSSLREYVPFGVFYLVLIPLGLLLLRQQLERRTAGTALVCGSAALLASVYLSRVAHPNYLILAAVLLPIGALAARWPSADAVVAPLALLAIAVEVSEGELFRAAWQRAVEARLPPHLEGMAARFAPHAGPGLTLDPVGLAVSAAAAGCGILYLLAGALARARAPRWALLALAALLVIAAPARALARIGSATGTPFAQHPWVAVANARAQQAWSTSFRGDPPGPLLESATAMAPGARSLASLPVSDPRPLLLLALAAAAVLAVHAAAPAPRILAAAIVVLAPPLAMGVVFGAPSALTLALLLAGWLMARRALPFAAGVSLGAAAAFDHRALLAIPFLLAPPPWRRGLWGLAAGYAILAVPGLLLAPEGVSRAVLPMTLRTSPGLASVALCWDVPPEPVALVLTASAWIAGVLAFVTAFRSRPAIAPALALAAAGSLAAVFVSVGAEPDDVGVPLALLALAAAQDGIE